MVQNKNVKKSNFYIKKIIAYLKSARLESILVSTSFLLLGIYYSNGFIPIINSILVFLALAMLVTAGSWQNYVFDIDVDKKAGKNIAFFEYISPRSMLFVSIIIGTIALGVLYYIDLYIFLFGSLEFLIFLIYAAPPIRLKNRVFFDFISNLLVFGAIPFLIGLRVLSLNIVFKDIILAVILGLLSGSYYLFISGFEIETDKEADIKNTCTYLGFKNNLFLSIIVFFISMVSFLLIFNINEKIILISYLVVAPIVVLTIFTKKIQVLVMLVSFMFLLWNGAVLLLLSIYTMSVLSIVFFMIILMIFIMAVYTWIVTEV